MVQVAHSLIREQLVDFLYQGFLVPVLGPALLQVCSKLSLTRLIVVLFYFLLFMVHKIGFVKIFIKKIDNVVVQLLKT